MFPSSNRPPAPTPPGQRSAPKAPAVEVEEVTVEQQEPDGDEIAPNPAAVGFRTEAETCGHCTYRAGDMCSHPIVARPVAPGDSCAVFEAGGDGIAEHDAGGMEMEGDGPTE